MRTELLTGVLGNHEREMISRQWLLKAHDGRQKKILPPIRKRTRNGTLWRESQSKLSGSMGLKIQELEKEKVR